MNKQEPSSIDFYQDKLKNSKTEGEKPKSKEDLAGWYDGHRERMNKINAKYDHKIFPPQGNQIQNDGDLSQYKTPVDIPNYFSEYYHSHYIHPKKTKWYSSKAISNLLKLGQRSKLIKTYIKEVSPGFKFLQLGNIYGKALENISKKLGSKGKLDIVDVVPLQVSLCYQKLQHMNNIDLWQQDITTEFHRTYDIIGAFFIFNELPLEYKITTLNHILDHVAKNNTKAVIVDYHPPYKFNPFKSILKIMNFYLHPFSGDLQRYSLQDLVENPEQFNWHKTTFFGSVFQKVVITKKKP